MAITTQEAFSLWGSSVGDYVKKVNVSVEGVLFIPFFLISKDSDSRYRLAVLRTILTYQKTSSKIRSDHS